MSIRDGSESISDGGLVDAVISSWVLQVPGVFISRLVRGGLAESTGLLGLNDEILEVNGIDVAGKSLDQVAANLDKININ